VSGARHVRGGSAQPSGYNLNYALWGRTDLGRSHNDRVAASAAGRCVRSRLAYLRRMRRWSEPKRARAWVDSTCKWGKTRC